MKHLFSSSHSLFLISLFFLIPAQASQQALLNSEEKPSDTELMNTPPSLPPQQGQSRTVQSIARVYRRPQAQRNNHAPCTDKDIAIFAGGGISGVFLVGLLLIVTKKQTPPTLSACAIPTTLDPNTDMSQQCWSDCVQIGDNPTLCGQQAYSPVNATAGQLTQALQSRYGATSQACLTTYDCSKIDNKPYNATNLNKLLYDSTSQRTQIQQNNAKTPKHLFHNKGKR